MEEYENPIFNLSKNNTHNIHNIGSNDVPVNDLELGLGLAGLAGLELPDDGLLEDELIDMSNYTRDTRDLVLSEQTMLDIFNNKSNCTAQQKYLSDAFRFLRSNKMPEFRKLTTAHTFIVNLKYNKTFLIHEACKLGKSDFVGFLLFLGAKCNVQDDHGLMASHYASRSKVTVSIDIIALFGNSLDVRDIDGNTPLHCAIARHDRDMVKTLMGYRANPNIKNKKNELPVDKCESNDLLESIIHYVVNY
jgi:hypothetical protein